VTAPTAGQTIGQLKPGAFKTLTKIQPAGALQVRKGATGAVSFYWRYSIGRTSERVSIGAYDAAAVPRSMTPTERGYSVAAAIRAAETLAIEHHQHRGEGGRPRLLQARREAEQALDRAHRLAVEQTLIRLLTDYCNYLEALGRRSHADARSIFRLHVFESWPLVAATCAREVTGEQFADMMRRLHEAGKGRTANKLRSYARAAYQVAKSAKSKPSIPVAFKAFEITSNPLEDTAPDETQNRPDKRPMSTEDLRTYWRVIKGMQGLRGAALRLHLLTGGQRIEQLVNLRTANVQPRAVVLYDAKGRPGRPPRPHVVPLIEEAVNALAQFDAKGTYALSTDHGVTHIAATTLSTWAAEAVRGEINDFQLKRVRSGVETLLAAARVPREIRGRLQSHGVAGVQVRHYDGHDYMAEKIEALEILHRSLC
jgi:integrase